MLGEHELTLYLREDGVKYWDIPIVIGERRCIAELKGSMDQEGDELGLFQFLKHNKATLTYAMLVRHQFTNRITKLPTQAMRDITRSKA